MIISVYQSKCFCWWGTSISGFSSLRQDDADAAKADYMIKLLFLFSASYSIG